MNNSSGRATITVRVATCGVALRWLNAECSSTASASPAASERSAAPPERSSIVKPINAKIAVVPPCMIAVPNPRTTQVDIEALGSSSRKWMFSTSAKPVPTAKPKIAASTRKPIRWLRTSTTMSRPFSTSSVSGET